MTRRHFFFELREGDLLTLPEANPKWLRFVGLDECASFLVAAEGSSGSYIGGEGCSLLTTVGKEDGGCCG